MIGVQINEVKLHFKIKNQCFIVFSTVLRDIFEMKIAVNNLTLILLQMVID